MPSTRKIIDTLTSNNAKAYFSKLYGDNPGVIDSQIQRYQGLADVFITEFPKQNNLDFFSAPGRTEVG
ncbi:MAG: hypothetical protein KAT29_06225, partial [Anaerolineales bacterium]|nr:hypothetical protein [Anaerolineales bacterium]